MTRLVLALCLLATAALAAPATQPGLRMSGPHTHENLTLFIIRGPDRVRGNYLTLEEAMREKKVVVHETSNVNELTVENRSDVAVYIQSGEIVKGGKQDRTLANDLVLAPHSRRVPIEA